MAIGEIGTYSGQTFGSPVTVHGGIGIPTPERLTVQREANDLAGYVQKAHDLLDLLTSAPAAQQGQVNAALMPLGAAVSSARAEATRLCERLDSLVQAVGQI